MQRSKPRPLHYLSPTRCSMLPRLIIIRAPHLKNILHHKAVAIAALIIWLIAGWSGAHGHLCFDGQEPPVSIHLDTLSEHPEHATDEQHVDVDLSHPLLAKLTKIDLPLLLAAALLLAVLFEKTFHIVSKYSHTDFSPRAGLRPPLRAPPCSST